MLKAVYVCDLCPPESPARVECDWPDSSMDAPMAEGWLYLQASVREKVLPAHLNAYAESLHAARPEVARLQADFLETTLQPFTTSIYICPTCRPVEIENLVRVRLKEKDERPGGGEPDPDPVQMSVPFLRPVDE